MNSKSTDTAAGKIADGDLELLSRYSDGEMSPMEARRLERRLDNEAELRLGLVRVEELNHRLRDVLAGQTSIPDSVSALLTKHAPGEAARVETDAPDEAVRKTDSVGKILPFPAARRAAGTTVGSMRWPGALAASIVIAVTAGIVMDGQEPSQLPGNDRFVDAALDSLPSGRGWSSLADGRELQPVLTFPHRDGNWCREYLLRGSDNNWRAVACHDGDRWVTQAAGLEAFMDSGPAYRPAGASDSAPVAVFISQHAADIALDAGAEADLLKEWSAGH